LGRLALKRATALRQSILKRAFEGKLVPQDPTDEPASVLLDRIRQQRETEAANGTARKRGNSRPRARQPDLFPDGPDRP
jgi:type I restriction enzyme, S subunit